MSAGRKPNTAGGFAALLWATRQRDGLTCSTKAVLIALSTFADAEGKAYPSIARLADVARVTDRTAQAAIRQLEALQYLALLRRGGRQLTTIYTLNLNRNDCREKGVTVSPFQGQKGATTSPIPRQETVQPLHPLRGERVQSTQKKGATVAPELLIELPSKALTRAREATTSSKRMRANGDRRPPPMPRVSDPPEAWLHLADRQPDGTPMVETNALTGEQIATYRRVHGRPPPDTDLGRPICGGYYLDFVAQEAVAAARYQDPNLRLDWRPLVGWLRDGIPSDMIVTTIRKIAERANYVPPASLRYFDRAIREAANPAGAGRQVAR